MSTKWSRRVLALGIVGALITPAGALAHGSGSRGADDQLQAGHQSELSSQSNTSSEAAAPTDRGRHGGRGAGNERFNLSGSVVSVDPSAQVIVVTIKKANHGRRGRVYVGQRISFDVASARINVKDVNRDGRHDLSDIAVGDAVDVQAELPRSGAIDLTQTVPAERVKDRVGGHDARHDSAPEAENHVPHV